MSAYAHACNQADTRAYLRAWAESYVGLGIGLGLVLGLGTGSGSGSGLAIVLD